VKLTKPGAGNNGSVDLTVDLTAPAAGTTCVPASSPVTTANKPWLLGNWGTTTYTADPTGRATFGLFKSADEFIYLREVY
jgi:MSHA biogenesis protein MshQ